MPVATRSQGLIWKYTLTLFHCTAHRYGDYLPRVSASREGVGGKQAQYDIYIDMPYWLTKGLSREITTWNQLGVLRVKTQAQRWSKSHLRPTCDESDASCSHTISDQDTINGDGDGIDSDSNYKLGQVRCMFGL